jgi:hypothetical protein
MRIILIVLIGLSSITARANQGEQGFVWGELTSVQLDTEKARLDPPVIQDKCVIYVEAPFPFKGAPNAKTKILERTYGFVTSGLDCFDNRSRLNSFVDSSNTANTSRGRPANTSKKVVIPIDSYTRFNLANDEEKNLLSGLKVLDPNAFYVHLDNTNSLKGDDPVGATVLGKSDFNAPEFQGKQCVVYLELEGNVKTNYGIVMPATKCADVKVGNTLKVNVPNFGLILIGPQITRLRTEAAASAGKIAALKNRDFFFLQLQADKSL